MKSLSSTIFILFVVVVSIEAQSFYLNCSQTQGSSYNPLNNTCVVCATQSPCSVETGCKTVSSSCQPVQISDLTNFTSCTTMDPNFGFYGGACKLCSALTQAQCTQGCKYVNNKCVGKNAADYSLNYNTCVDVTNTYSALGYRSDVQPACINCQAVSKVNCPNTSGCKVNYSNGMCGGLMVSDYFQNPTGCLALGRGFAFIYYGMSSTCFNCGALMSDQACQENSVQCVSSTALNDTICIGRKPNDTMQTLSSCSVFGRQYGFQGANKPCLDCSQIATSDDCTLNKSCYYANDQCSGLSLNSPNITPTICENFGATFTYNTAAKMCVDCSSYTGKTCPSNICLVSGASCTAVRMSNAVDYTQCTKMSPNYGWNSITKQCRDCSAHLNRVDCDVDYYCIYAPRTNTSSQYSCMGRTVTDYNADKVECLERDPNFAFKTLSLEKGGAVVGQCINCAELTQGVCQTTKSCSYSAGRCTRFHPDYSACSQITVKYQCLPISTATDNIICQWDAMVNQCRVRSCADLQSQQQCTNINGQKCTFANNICQPLGCEALLDQTSCNRYQYAPYNVAFQCTWAQATNQCVTFDNNYQCHSYLNLASCQSQQDGLSCNWNAIKYTCEQQTCPSLITQGTCEAYSKADTQLNFQNCLWVKANSSSTLSSCVAYSLATCENIQNQPTCNDPDNASGLTCLWSNGACTTLTCQQLSPSDCARYVSPQYDVNGVHCYPTSAGCAEVNSSLQCSSFIEQVSCTTYPNVANQGCAWRGGACSVANCTTFASTSCQSFTTPTLMNNQLCQFDGKACQPASCELLVDAATCSHYFGVNAVLHCAYLQGKCITKTSNSVYSCSGITVDSVCNLSLDSSNGQCQWNVANLRCQPFSCAYLQGSLLPSCNYYSMPATSTNGYNCVPMGQTCQQVVPDYYSCRTFNGNMQLCQAHNFLLTKSLTSTCIYSNTTQVCYDAQYTRESHNNAVCSDFASSEQDCHQALFKTTYRATILCQYVNKTCIATQGNVCSGIVVQSACVGAHIAGSNACVWVYSPETQLNQCQESVCATLNKFECLTSPPTTHCRWNTADATRPLCERLNILSPDISALTCISLGGQYNELTMECGPKQCQHQMSARACGQASGLLHKQLNCYVNIVPYNDSLSSCMPRLDPYSCQVLKNSGLMCSSTSATIGQCFQKTQDYGWNGECVSCVGIQSEKNCFYTGSACAWNTTTKLCSGQRLNNGPTFSTYMGCLASDASLGFAPTAATKCNQCLLLSNNDDCSYLDGCHWVSTTSNSISNYTINSTTNSTTNNSGYCTGLRSGDAFYSSANGRARCESIPEQGYSDNGVQSECQDCSGAISIDSCTANPICAWIFGKCLGKRLNQLKQQYTFMNCAAFGGRYGYDPTNAVCLDCMQYTDSLSCDSHILTCNWDPLRTLCRGLRPDDQQITYEQCQAFGATFGFSQSTQSKCINCALLTTSSQCLSMPDVCVLTSTKKCYGKRPSIATDFQSCSVYAPKYGFDTSSNLCSLCQLFNQTTCAQTSYCSYSDLSGCTGRQLAAYNVTDCLNLGTAFAETTNQTCLDCQQSSKTCGQDNKFCKYEIVSPATQQVSCLRSRDCFTECTQISQQQDCRDILALSGSRKTCSWQNGACMTTQCTQFTNQASCMVGIAANNINPNCAWLVNKCIPQSCSLIPTQEQCGLHFTQAINEQFCSWNTQSSVCTQVPISVGSSCQNFPNQIDCVSPTKPVQINTQCSWNAVGNSSSLCQMARCGSLLRKDACNAYSQNTLNSFNCYWQANDQGGVCNQLKPDQACPTFNNEKACTLSAVQTNCMWLANACMTRTCSMQVQETACTIYSIMPIAAGQYCLWVPINPTANANANVPTNSSGNATVATNGTYSSQCTTVNSIQCKSLTQNSCQQVPSSSNDTKNPNTYCAWNAKSTICEEATCSSLNSTNCQLYQTVPYNGKTVCLYNGATCNALSEFNTCVDFTTQSSCNNQTALSSNCLWNAALSPASCQVGQCSLLTSEASCMTHSGGLQLNGKYCIWQASSSSCTETKTVSCNQFSTQTSCIAPYNQVHSACSWLFGVCSDVSCANLTPSQCTTFSKGLPNGSYCDLVGGACVTLNTPACGSIVNRDVCLNSQFDSGACSYDGVALKCAQTSCSSQLTACDCNSPSNSPKCTYNFSTKVCQTATCDSGDLTQKQCGQLGGCTWSPLTKSCSTTSSTPNAGSTSSQQSQSSSVISGGKPTTSTTSTHAQMMLAMLITSLMAL